MKGQQICIWLSQRSFILSHSYSEAVESKQASEKAEAFTENTGRINGTFWIRSVGEPSQVINQAKNVVEN